MSDGILPAKRGTHGDNHVETNAVSKAATGKSNKDGSMDEDLMHVYEEFDIGKKTRQQLVDAGVTTVKDILGRQDDFKEATVGLIRKVYQQQLYHFCLWHEDFYKKNEESEPWRGHFTIGSLDAFVEESLISKAGVMATFDHALDMLHEGNQGELGHISKQEREALYSQVAELVIQELPDELVKACQFDVKDYITNCARAIFNLPTGDPYPKIQLKAGQTQSGKSNVKAVVQATCDLLRCPLIIITKGVAESKDLSKKIWNLLNQGKTEFDVFWNGGGQDNRSTVVPDTAARIKKTGIPAITKLRKIKPHGKFVIIVDECDAMYRTDGRGQQMEQAYDELMGMIPALRIEISATPIPTLLFLTDRGYEVEVMELGTSEDYSGVTEMKPLQDERGTPLYVSAKGVKYSKGVRYEGINQRSLKKCDADLLFPNEEGGYRFKEVESRVFSTVGKLKFIPHTDRNVMKLYEDALSIPEAGKPKKKGVLLLDCTNNRVTAENNIFQKAACVQNHFARKKKAVAIVVFVGGGIHIRRPGFLNGRKIPNSKTVSEVIEQLDEELGLGVPIFVFGYSKMKRCISYRSEHRVPTHMVLSLGLGQSNESYIQALGRATFNGLETVLHENGFSHVSVLTTESDLAMSRKYTNFVHEVSERLKSGATVEEVMNDARKLFTDSSNYLRHTNRKTGQIKRLKTLLPDQRQFEVPVGVSSYSIEDTKKRVMKAVLDLIHDSLEMDSLPDKVSRSGNVGKGDCVDKEVEEALEKINKRGFAVKEIMCKYNDTYQDDEHTIKRAALSKELTQLKNEAKLEQFDDKRWGAKNLWALVQECSYTHKK